MNFDIISLHLTIKNLTSIQALLIFLLFPTEVQCKRQCSLGDNATYVD